VKRVLDFDASFTSFTLNQMIDLPLILEREDESNSDDVSVQISLSNVPFQSPSPPRSPMVEYSETDSSCMVDMMCLESESNNSEYEQNEPCPTESPVVGYHIDSQLILTEDRGLVPDHLVLVMWQMVPCKFTKADQAGRCYKGRELGFIGMCCKHCILW
jgi:hypothetical protein